MRTAIKLLEEAHAALEMYGMERRYIEKECRATGLTVAADEGGELAREMCLKLEEGIRELGVRL